MVKKITQYLCSASASLLAVGTLAFAVLSANSACCGPFYEPEQPKELKALMKYC